MPIEIRIKIWEERDGKNVALSMTYDETRTEPVTALEERNRKLYEEAIKAALMAEAKTAEGLIMHERDGKK